jgi:hypothetical protein
MVGLIILFGESFRLGGQDSRNRGSQESFDGQIKASNTHVILANILKENQDCDIEFYIASYNTQFDEEINNIYSSKLIGYDYYEHLIGPGELIHNTLNKINNNKYDFILIQRIDLYLKEEFIKIFNTKWDKILFPSICFKPHHKIGIHPRVNDMMIFFPKKYYKYLKDFRYGHSAWHDFIKMTDLKYEDIDTMINTYHDSDSAKDYNPLYYIVNRHVSNIWHTNHEIFNKYNF